MVNASAFASLRVGGLIIKLRRVRVKLNSLKYAIANNLTKYAKYMIVIEKSYIA